MVAFCLCIYVPVVSVVRCILYFVICKETCACNVVKLGSPHPCPCSGSHTSHTPHAPVPTPQNIPTLSSHSGPREGEDCPSHSSHAPVTKPQNIQPSPPLQALEEVKIREMAIIDLQKRISEGETKLKQQQNLYEAVRADRNLYSKNLIESQDEIQEMKRKFKIMQHQIEQLKEEISAKDLALVKEHFDHMKVRGCTACDAVLAGGKGPNIGPGAGQGAL